ncbi:MAG: glucosaminidase domain-containing protein [Pegethrix bostrychoides GSE-TBD4-15B]|uniref:Glucosaminidase domain-containing protein n=1 Tax=Pegethrix bostrychoides GSE-TBD4-15B TaxID=2839662 RepID=A0A951PC57_9CYAN|nr:glucosaminidase domain-containing protein [Pegethrix bostrychoides GSE-TBD4-15B]
MGRVFVAPAYGNIQSGSGLDGGATAGEISLACDLVVQYLRANQYEAALVPPELTAEQGLAWINRHAQRDDVAMQLGFSFSQNPQRRGSSLVYIAANDQRRSEADQLLQILLRRAPQLLSQGIQADTACPGGSSAFCRQLEIPAMLLRLGYLSNATDRQILQTQRSEISLGIAEGLALWSRTITAAAQLQPVPAYPSVNVNLNGAVIYGEGIIVQGDFYVPMDLVDQLGVVLPKTAAIRRLSYRNLVYLRAIDLRDYNLSVQPDKENHALILRNLLVYPDQLDQIMGRGTASEVQMIMFLKSQNPAGFAQFTELPKLYREEAAIEGVNADIAFAQMCVETDFLHFSGLVQPSQYNFAGLGGLGDAPEGASFRDARIGVRAQIQHLKAYATPEPLVQESVDPRFGFVRRGVAPRVADLGGRWAIDPQYGQKIKAVLRLIYESAGFL